MECKCVHGVAPGYNGDIKFYYSRLDIEISDQEGIYIDKFTFCPDCGKRMINDQAKCWSLKKT